MGPVPPGRAHPAGIAEETWLSYPKEIHAQQPSWRKSRVSAQLMDREFCLISPGISLCYARCLTSVFSSTRLQQQVVGWHAVPLADSLQSLPFGYLQWKSNAGPSRGLSARSDIHLGSPPKHIYCAWQTENWPITDASSEWQQHIWELRAEREN